MEPVESECQYPGSPSWLTARTTPWRKSSAIRAQYTAIASASSATEPAAEFSDALVGRVASAHSAREDRPRFEPSGPGQVQGSIPTHQRRCRDPMSR